MNLSSPNRQAILIASVTAVAVLLSGATSGTRSIVLFLMAGAIVIAPPHRRHGQWLFLLAALVLAGSCVAFLPAVWFVVPAWRTTLCEEIGIQLPPTVSPQPWLSAEAIFLLLASLTWLFYVTSRHWTRQERSRSCRIFALGAVALGAVYVALEHTGTTWLGAIYGDQFGPFPNRNQTASVLLLGGILAVGLINLPGPKRRVEKLSWIAALIVLFVALATVGSRTAIILFAVAAIVLSLRRATLPAFAITGSAILLTVGGLILADSDVVKKFKGSDGVLTTASENGRWPLYRDSWEMLREVPLTGTGIGNFEDVFAMHRRESAAPNRALHPDSDFAWAAAELGLPTTLVLGTLVVGLCGLILPLHRESGTDSRRDHSLRLTCAVAVAAFICHGFVDVPAHRLGTLLPAILLLGLAIHPRRDFEPAFRGQRCAFGACAVVPALALMLIPTPPRALDADTHLASAQRHLGAGQISKASADFEKARFLRPHNAKLALAEGRAWLNISPPHAIAAWREAIARARIDGRSSEFFHEIHKATAPYPEIGEEIWLLADGDPALQLVAVGRSGTEGRREKTREILGGNPDLVGWNSRQISKLLDHYGRHHGSGALLEAVRRRPDWTDLCWRQLARAHVANDDYLSAFEVINRSCRPPDLSILNSTLTFDALRSEHLRSPHNLTTAIRLAHQYMRRNESGRALAILQKIDGSHDDKAPIVHFMIAHCLAQQSEHEKAHQALITYVEMSK